MTVFAVEPSPLFDEHRLPDFQREFLAHTVTQLESSGKLFSKDLHSIDRSLLGVIIAEHLPPEMLAALQELYSGNGPPVLVLRNFPIRAVQGKKPENQTRYILEGLGFAMAAREGDENASLKIKPQFISNNVLHGIIGGTADGNVTQRYHHDLDAEKSISVLACVHTGGPGITTNFTRDKTFEGHMDHQNGPEDVVKIKLENGDIVVFQDSKVIHARENPGKPMGWLEKYIGRKKAPEEKYRTLQAAELFRFNRFEPSDDWSERMYERARQVLGPQEK